MKKKSPKIQLAVKPSPELERSIEELADVLIEHSRHEAKELEPFEVYAQKVRSHIFDSVHEFRHRFVHGYELLLEEIVREHEDK